MQVGMCVIQNNINDSSIECSKSSSMIIIIYLILFWLLLYTTSLLNELFSFNAPSKKQKIFHSFTFCVSIHVMNHECH